MNKNKNKKFNIKKIIISILFICVLLLLVKINNNNIENFGVPTNHERPFVNVFGYEEKTKTGTQIEIVLLSHPFTRDSSWDQYNQYKNDKFLILGISSYSEFPKITSNKLDSISNPDDKAWKYDYMKVVKGWLHCFREPSKFIDEGIPKALISESDFCRYDTFKPDDKVKKIYDFIYLCPKDSETDDTKKNDCFGWVASNKNWTLALKCLKVLCGKFKLKGLLVGRKGCEMPKECDGLIETTNFLSQGELIDSYRKSKFILIPNKVDASPRVLVEALCCNIPILVNNNLLGGWKYVNNNTGAFFNDENDIDKGIKYILDNNNNFTPRKYYIENYGKENSGKKLKEFVETHFKKDIDVSKYDYLYI